MPLLRRILIRNVRLHYTHYLLCTSVRAKTGASISARSITYLATFVTSSTKTKHSLYYLVLFSDWLLNSHSQKIHTKKQFSAFHRSHFISVLCCEFLVMPYSLTVKSLLRAAALINFRQFDCGY